MSFSPPYVASIAKSLNSEEVPCVLWGHYLLNVHGVPSIIGSIDFVVPDSHLTIGRKVLTRFQSLKQCLDPEVCATSSQERPAPPPAFHMHVSGTEVTVDLYPQSEALWFLPTLDAYILPAKHNSLPPSFTLASDHSVLPPWRPGRGSGVFDLGNHPVVVPKAHILLEAFLRLYARDLGKWIGAFAMANISYMEEYVDEDGLLDADLLPEPLRTSYAELKLGKKTIRQWGKDFRMALGLPQEADNDSSE